ncbi:MAG: response regulator [Bacteroidales bacterium]|nr:response regulator [Bacteroidales bacterium]
MKKRWTAAWTALVLMVVAGVSAAAQDQYAFRHFTRSGGALPYDGVRVILEDSRNQVWIGTQKGLSRYDGKRFALFDRDQFGVMSDHVCALAEDAKGNIWVGTDDGIIVYDISTGGFRRIAEDLIDTRVYTMKRDSCGFIWIGTSGKGLYRAEGEQVREVPGVDISHVYRIDFVAPDAVALASYCENLYLLESPYGTDPALSVCASGAFRGDDIEGLVSVPVQDGTILYVASKSKGLCRLDTRGGPVETLLQLPEGHRPVALAGSGRYLWLATTEGLIRYDILTGGSLRLAPDPDDPFSLGDDYIRDVYVTASGDLWVGTDHAGVDVFSAQKNRFRNYYRLSGGGNLASCIVRGFAQTGDGDIWVATQRNGLLRLSDTGDGGQPELRTVCRPLLPSNITAVCADGDVLWLGSQQGLIRFDPVTSDVKLYSRFDRNGGTADNRVVSLYRTRDGSLYVGAATGVMRYDRQEDDFVVVEALYGLTVEDFEEDAAGRLWLATYAMGVCRFDPRTGTVTGRYGKHYGRGPIHDMTSSVCRDAGGTVWTIGFSSGLYRYDEVQDRFDNFNCENTPQLPTDLYLTAIPDGKGCLWISSDAGLVQFHPQTRAVAVYGEEDGMLGGSFIKSGLRLGDGTLLFGMADGFIRFHPDDFEVPAAPALAPAGPWDSVGAKLLIGFVLITLSAAVAIILILLGMSRREKRREQEREREREEQLYHEKMNFISGIVHEIKTPLTLIQTPLQHLLASAPQQDDRQRAGLGAISRSTDYLDRLVRELLDFIRAEEHGYILEQTDQDLSSRIGFIVSTFNEIAKSRNIRLGFTAPGAPVVTAVDAKAFDKILNNLLDNAVKYSESYVRISLEQEGERVLVRITNDGPSIPRERRERIFGAFVRYGDNRRPYAASFGIGLSFARHLAELHGGSLTLSDREDCTEFVLSLPLKQVSPEPEMVDIEAEVNASSQPLVLVVEDNHDLASYIRRTLKPSYRVFCVPSAEKALDLLAHYDIDIILTDIGLQGMSGVELCRRVSQDERLSHIPIIVLSAISGDDTKIKCMQYGASAYIEKPFTIDYLLACVKGQLDKRRTIKAWAAADSPDLGRLQLADRDEQFVKALDKLVAEHLSDPAFSNKQMEEVLCMSHSSLNRRVNALLGTTPNEYLRSKRLETAARMLRESPSVLVADVCYAVGFSNPSYFARCFSAAYGKSPTEWKEQRQG